MKVELIYLDNETKAFHQTLILNEKCCVKEAIESSTLLDQYKTLSLDTLSMGIFSQKVDLSHELNEGDRIEIYRGLTISPMEKRRLLASKRK